MLLFSGIGKMHRNTTFSYLKVMETTHKEETIGLTNLLVHLSNYRQTSDMLTRQTNKHRLRLDVEKVCFNRYLLSLGIHFH